MPAARESLLDAAFAELAARSWAVVRMVDVAAVAGVSRQTLYNEFGSKDGLARALVRREADSYLQGVDRALAGPGEAGAGERLSAVAQWTVTQARSNPLVRAALTGCWGERLPSPLRVVGASSASTYIPSQRRADAPLPSPSELIGQVRDRAVAALSGFRPGIVVPELAVACEVAVRLALAYVVAPAGIEDAALLVREALSPQVRGHAPEANAQRAEPES